MGRIVRLALATVENLPSQEIALQLAGPQAMRRRLFIRLRNVNNRNQDSTRDDSLLRRRKEISLQVVADRDEIPTGRLNLIFELFEVRNFHAHSDAATGSSASQNFDGSRRAIHGRDAPTLFSKPKRVAAGSAGQGERPGRRQPLRHFYQEWRRRCFYVLSRSLPRPVALIPTANFHRTACASNLCFHAPISSDVETAAAHSPDL